MNVRVHQMVRAHIKIRNIRWRKMTEEQQDEFIEKKFAELGINLRDNDDEKIRTSD